MSKIQLGDRIRFGQCNGIVFDEDRRFWMVLTTGKDSLTGNTIESLYKVRKDRTDLIVLKQGELTPEQTDLIFDKQQVVRRQRRPAISTRMPPVVVAYDVAGGSRREKEFIDPFAAKRFWMKKDGEGKNPKLLRRDP